MRDKRQYYSVASRNRFEIKTNSHNKTLYVLLTLVTTFAVVNATLFPYFGNKLIRLSQGFYGENVYLCLCY